jgi:hypothetical protein
MKNDDKINDREFPEVLPLALAQSCILNSGKKIMKKTKKRKLFYCKRCTGKFSKDFVKKMDGYYVCLTCVGIEEYLNGKGFSDYPLYGGTEKV